MTTDAARELDTAVARQVCPQQHGDAPYYCTDMREAWGLVTWLRARGWSFVLRDYGDGWWASFYNDWARTGQSGATAPEAICRAALTTAGAPE